jgi:D-sedoheptulose 7-phosphate isomerase
MSKLFKDTFRDSAELMSSISQGNSLENLTAMGDIIVDSIVAGGKLLICGNGGSASDAQHLAAELLVRLKSSTNRKGVPAIALTMDSSTLTACANDYGYELMFSRMVETLGKKGDVLLGITTSGKSKNINLALDSANNNDIHTMGFLGSGGGDAKALCKTSFIVPSQDTARIQESHIIAGHALMEYVETSLFDKEYLTIIT